MTGRLLVAGVGNLFFSDDGFGPEAARRLARRRLGPDVAVRDFGTGGIHLAFELLEPFESVVILDALPRGGDPGTLYVVEPEVDGANIAAVGSGHGVDLPTVFAQATSMGGQLPPITIIGCEPADVGEGIGLSFSVERAVEKAIELVEQVARRKLVYPAIRGGIQ